MRCVDPLLVYYVIMLIYLLTLTIVHLSPSQQCFDVVALQVAHVVMTSMRAGSATFCSKMYHDLRWYAGNF